MVGSFKMLHLKETNFEGCFECSFVQFGTVSNDVGLVSNEQQKSQFIQEKIFGSGRDKLLDGCVSLVTS